MDMKTQSPNGLDAAVSTEPANSDASRLPGNLFMGELKDPQHAVLRTSMLPPYPKGCDVVLLGMGCFWGAERRIWQLQGVHTTAVGYAGGVHINPDYQLVCTGQTGHAEVVLVVYRPSELQFARLLQVFFEAHDPTQGMRQGNDIGTQYRSTIYTTQGTQTEAARQVASDYEAALRGRGYPALTTEIRERCTFYFAEPYHQQYLAKNPNGYCGLRGTGVSCPVPGLSA